MPLSCCNGYVYGRTILGDLWLWRHHGFLTGEGTWSQGAKAGVGWGGNITSSSSYRRRPRIPGERDPGPIRRTFALRGGTATHR